MNVIHGTSAATLHAQVVLKAIGWAHVPPAGEIIWLWGSEDGDVHGCPEATADKNNRTGRIQTKQHLFQSIDFKTNTERADFYFLGWITF